MKYIDIHGHVNFAVYDGDRKQVIDRAIKAGVAMITVGTQIDTSRLAVELAHKYDHMYAIVGLHPIHTSKCHHDEQELGVGNKEFVSRGEVVDLDYYYQLAEDPKTVAIGECGLDYYHLDPESEIKQREAFLNMIDIANKVNKPIMLHLRNGSNRSAYLDAYKILKDNAKVKGDLHFFAGSVEEAKPFLDLGYFFSFTGAITFGHNYDEIIKYIPLDRIMSETDCPYVSPVPNRGKRNEPVNVIDVVKKIAEIRGGDVDVVGDQLFRNAENLLSVSR
jgi:TatD DNase family protein